MSTPKIFVTGATGYIGGDAFVALNQKHPDWHYTCLVRNSDRGALIAKDFPKVRLVYGDLDSAELLEHEAADADIVAHFASADHQAGIDSLVAGLKRGGKQSYLVHLSGTGILTYPDIEEKTFGEARSKVWDDVRDIDAIINDIPESAPHRMVDLAVLKSGLKAAIVAPPTIWGPGRGSNPRSIQIPTLAQSFAKQKRGFFVGEGQNHWTHIHVQDLSDVFVLLIEDAAAGGTKASWGPKAYYYTENGDFVWGDVCRAVANEVHARGIIDSPDCVGLPADEIEAICKFGTMLWGSNSRATATRARQELGWEPQHSGFLESIGPSVEHEHGLIKAGTDPKFRV